MADKTSKRTNDSTPASSPKKDVRRASDMRQRDLASDIQGRNKLQGNDQQAVHNQRHEQPKVGGATGRPPPDDGQQ